MPAVREIREMGVHGYILLHIPGPAHGNRANESPPRSALHRTANRRVRGTVMAAMGMPWG